MTTNVCDHCMSGSYRDCSDCHYPEYLAAKQQQAADELAGKLLAEWPDCDQCSTDSGANFCASCGKPLNNTARKTFAARLLPIITAT